LVERVIDSLEGDEVELSIEDFTVLSNGAMEAAHAAEQDDAVAG
jgi:hypothetical protein